MLRHKQSSTYENCTIPRAETRSTSPVNPVTVGFPQYIILAVGSGLTRKPGPCNGSGLLPGKWPGRVDRPVKPDLGARAGSRACTPPPARRCCTSRLASTGVQRATPGPSLGRCATAKPRSGGWVGQRTRNAETNEASLGSSPKPPSSSTATPKLSFKLRRRSSNLPYPTPCVGKQGRR